MSESTNPTPEDKRFSYGLVMEVFDVLERHGYRKGDDVATGRAYGLLFALVQAYEGQQEGRS